MAEPSDTELELLKLFWAHGPMSGREVHAHAGPELGWADSTTRTVLERMKAKGLLTRRSVHGMAVYEAARAKVDVLAGVLRKVGAMLEVKGPLPASAFGGSQILNESEIAELEALLAEEPAEAGD